MQTFFININCNELEENEAVSDKEIFPIEIT